MEHLQLLDNKMEYYKEYWERWECRYWLREIESCRKCLFETLCRLEKDKKKSEQVLDHNQ